jgi:hypothetical protein
MIVILNLFQDNKPRLRVILKQVQDDEGGELIQIQDDTRGVNFPPSSIHPIVRRSEIRE